MPAQPYTSQRRSHRWGCSRLSPQRIEAAALGGGGRLRYFGRSLDARLDLDGDGLLDLAVGAQGAAVLLR